MDSIKNSIAKQERDLISIIVPCYNEEKVLPAFYKAASDAVTEIESADCEFIFVDDGSRDRTPELLQNFSQADSRSLFRYAMDGILSFSSAPVTLAGTAGGLLLFAAVITGIIAVLSGHGLEGIPLLVCLILGLNGIQMLFLSLLGQYMSRDYMESKKRPIYIVKKKGGF